jgi:2-oxoglutarate ferredoxin oxidoreductase subunit alpha
MMATATHLLTPEEARADSPLEAVVVRFAGDSGDGMQLTGGQFTLSTALAGNDLATFPDFPAEIRAPQGDGPAEGVPEAGAGQSGGLRAGGPPAVGGDLLCGTGAHGVPSGVRGW